MLQIYRMETIWHVPPMVYYSAPNDEVHRHSNDSEQSKEVQIYNIKIEHNLLRISHVILFRVNKSYSYSQMLRV